MTILEDSNFGHKSVLLNELVSAIKLDENKKNIVVDCTLGLAGHAIEVIKKMNPGDIFVGFDADNDNLESARKIIEEKVGDEAEKKGIKIYLINSNFRFLKEKLNEIGIDKVNNIYYDLGVSSVHLDDFNKGFSFRGEGALDMRYDRTSGITAKDVINEYSENDLYRVFREYGEEKKSKFIVDEILLQRKTKQIETTKDLLEIIEKSSFDPKSKTRVFQAIRIEVNDEFGVIRESVKDAVKILEIGGILAIITFHSLEDRIAKQIINGFIETEIDQITGQSLTKPVLEKVSKKPIEPSESEIRHNPRSRSSKLRIARKINNIT
ncbi:MAG: 16S rRNA (cytosine(1402)-N(4))-methyltransferase RsmH [Candidatus Gracilibacteria bacterium]|nr:16S rRNA (cytosine(1402)-N(4))-methyltransferase RsmH [Candidatus Gracilibacteria bacterium]